MYLPCLNVLLLLISENFSEVRKCREHFLKEEFGPRKDKALMQVKAQLIKCQEVWDEKIELSNKLTELIEGEENILNLKKGNLGPPKNVNGNKTLIIHIDVSLCVLKCCDN